MLVKDSKLLLNTNVTILRGVGSVYNKALSEAGILTIKDLLWSLPYKYIDHGNLQTIRQLYSTTSKENNTVMVFGTIKNIKQNITNIKHISLVEATIDDGTGMLRLIWFNQPYLVKFLRVGYQLLAFGHIYYGHNGLEIRSPQFEVINNKSNLVNRYLPLYKKIGPISSYIRQRLVKEAFLLITEYDDWLPIDLVRNLPDVMTALYFLHQPPNNSDPIALQNCTTLAHQRLCCEELFAFSLGIALRRSANSNLSGKRIFPTVTLSNRLKKFLPFRLTSAQRLAFKDIVKDVTSGRVMHRLLQGDVGSGKTLVAFLAMAMIAESDGQAALLVPTEILASQHTNTIKKLAIDCGANIQCLVGSMKQSEKQLALSRIKSGEARYIIGTHALFQEAVRFNNLQLIVVDEQHRFGVKQREAIKQKGLNPHWLVMSATPIPRSLALTIFGDLDQSILDELPPGRQPISTRLIHPDESYQIWKLIDCELKLGHQVFVISPAIDTSNVKVRDIKTMELFLRKRFPNQTIATIHGRLKDNEIAYNMKLFADGKAKILLATTVVEVGINIPNATVMVVDNAERFGLSQLHQLRGRIGRGSTHSYFIMLSKSETERLIIMTQTCDGFHIAQKDLELRGPGEFFGIKQSGLPQFQVADLLRDKKILHKCRQAANQMVEIGLSDAQLQWLKHEKFINIS